MRVLGVIQARMGSTRLAGKVLQPLAGRSVLGWVVQAARESAELDGLVVATTLEPDDDRVVTECERLGVAWHRGSVEDVLSRFIGAMDALGQADAVMRFSADNPLYDPEVIAMAVRVFRGT